MQNTLKCKSSVKKKARQTTHTLQQWVLRPIWKPASNQVTPPRCASIMQVFQVCGMTEKQLACYYSMNLSPPFFFFFFRAENVCGSIGPGEGVNWSVSFSYWAKKNSCCTCFPWIMFISHRHSLPVFILEGTDWNQVSLHWLSLILKVRLSKEEKVKGIERKKRKRRRKKEEEEEKEEGGGRGREEMKNVRLWVSEPCYRWDLDLLSTSTVHEAILQGFRFRLHLCVPVFNRREQMFCFLLDHTNWTLKWERPI